MIDIKFYKSTHYICSVSYGYRQMGNTIDKEHG